jgi:signal transduction histidine kinase
VCSSDLLSLAAAEWKTDIAQRLAAAQCELTWHFTLDQDITLNMVQWSSLTRVLRELVSNILAHAEASHVSIACELQQGRFTLLIQDDGKGRNPEAWRQGLGLGGTRKRVKLMSGSITWRELEPRGVECLVVVPRLAQVSATRSS